MKITKNGVFLYFPVDTTCTRHQVHWSGWEFGMEMGETLPSTEEEINKERVRLMLEQIALGAGLEPPRRAEPHRTATLVLMPTRPGQPPATDGGTTKESANGVQEENPGAVDSGSDRGSDGVKEGATGQENAAQEEGQIVP